MKKKREKVDGRMKREVPATMIVGQDMHKMKVFSY